MIKISTTRVDELTSNGERLFTQSEDGDCGAATLATKTPSSVSRLLSLSDFFGRESSETWERGRNHFPISANTSAGTR